MFVPCLDLVQDETASEEGTLEEVSGEEHTISLIALEPLQSTRFCRHACEETNNTVPTLCTSQLVGTDRTT